MAGSWSEKFGVVVFGATGRADYEDVARAAGEEFADRIGDLMDRYRRGPTDNLLSLLLADENRPGGLTTTEISGACSLLLFAGHDTTSSLLGSATVALLEHPEQADAMRSVATDVDLAIEEMLRYESPAKAMMRNRRRRPRTQRSSLRGRPGGLSCHLRREPRSEGLPGT